MWKRTRSLTISCLVGAFFLSACGGATDDEVRAINLTSGQTESFPSEGDVPSGWAPCPTPECDVLPPDIPCQNISGEVCELNPACRLEVLRCDGSAPNDPAAPQGADAVDPAAPDAPQLTDPLDPAPTQTCEVMCLPKAVEGCEVLDEASCRLRPDCAWAPMPCPLCFDPEGSGQPGTPEEGLAPIPGCACPSLCQPALPPAPSPCPPALPIAPDNCPDGVATPIVDPIGCVTGYICDGCPPVAPPAEKCDGGILEPVFMPSGCQIGWACVPTTTSCQELASDYQDVLRAAKRCDPVAADQDTTCAEPVSDSLFCGCMTFVNGANRASIDKLAVLQSKANLLSCFKELACTAVACMPPSGASCEISATGLPTPDTAGGSCSDI